MRFILSFFPLVIFFPVLILAESSLLRVGIVLPLSGPLSIIGVPLKNAFLLAQEQLDKDKKLTLVFDDDGFIPRDTVTAVNKIIAVKKPQAIIVFGTNQGLAVVDIIEKVGIPFLSLNVNRSVVKNKKNSFLLMPSVESLTAKNVEGIRQREYKRLAIIASIQDSALLQKKFVIDSKVTSIVHTEEINMGEMDVRIPVLRTLAAKPDAIFLSTLPPQGSVAARRIRELGFKGDLFGGIQLAFKAELNAGGSALEGAWVVSGDDRQSQKFLEDYKKRFGEEPLAEAIFAYDTIHLLLEGVKSGDIAHYLRTVQNFQGAIGTFSADGDNGFTFPVAIKKYSKGTFSY